MLHISESVIQALRIPEAEIAERLRTELAVALYAQDAFSLGKAAELTQMCQRPFAELLGKRGIARHYGAADLAKDVLYSMDQSPGNIE